MDRRQLRFTERDKCPLCQSRKRHIYFDFADIPVVICRCGFAYSSLVMDRESLLKYYELYGGVRHLLGQQINAKNNLAVLERMLDFKQIENVLEVGAGYGFFLRNLLSRYPHLHATGVEMSDEESRYARDEFGLHIVSELQMSEGPFDLVMSFEVIEHVKEPVEFVSDLARRVAPNGWLIIMTDNFFSPVVKSLGPEFPKWIPHTHICHFSKETLMRCIESVPGLEVRSVFSYSPWEVLGRELWVRLRRHREVRECYDIDASLDSEMGESFRLFRLRSLLNPLWTRLALRRNGNGTLIYVAARKVR